MKTSIAPAHESPSSQASLDHVCIHTTTDGHGAEDVPVLADPHFRPFLAWGRSHGIDQGGEGDTPLDVTKLFELLEKFVHEFYPSAVPRQTGGAIAVRST